MNKFLATPLTALVFGLARQLAVAQQPDTLKDRQALALLVTNYENAWNRHDAQGLAAQYHPDATWVNWFGAYSKGRPDIQAHYATVHGTYFKTSHYYTRSVEDLTFVKPDVAIMHVRTGLSGDTRYPNQTFEFRRTLVLTKRNGTWGILAGQNAKLNDGIK
ncbi:YybH family protein [Hymenobacter sp. PAMC 26628]|uniref:YybH family protein n=1 Tax=Hymenobacter sp. PAMC 26628 TaxID=1484118 RepID=UPI00076FF799|nr:SgcJ/EcaC family oxidoreductase [Hymenobacter sp. PAMC 26628]AMJ67271.1 hypothetical protein AXW84_18955 [Hymenobacter sp. PAMC 26628]